jgi:LysR family transcriptional regulator, transcriptional activator of nhaA
VGPLNYHHLRYFWAVAREGGLTRAAERLNVSPSVLSTQLRRLEERLGHPLFAREGKRLELTEAGRIALDHAETIFRAGEELVGTLRGSGAPGSRRALRVGAVATLSRNFQLELLRPLTGRPDVELVVRSGSLRELLVGLAARTLDVVLSNLPVPRDAATGWRCRLLAEQPVSLVGRPDGEGADRPFRFPDDLARVPVLLPSLESDVRVAFDLILDQAGVRPTVLAEVDDMAMLRLLARESPGVALVPPVVVRDELRAGGLVERCPVPGLSERFYATTQTSRFPNPLLRELLAAAGEADRATMA